MQIKWHICVQMFKKTKLKQQEKDNAVVKAKDNTRFYGRAVKFKLKSNTRL